jgi:putative nucleotidyltransferase with HDIG domain
VSVTSAATQVDPAVAELIEQTRASRVERLGGRRLLTVLAFGLAFLVTALTMAVQFGSDRQVDGAQVLVFVIAYALASRVAFEISTGWALPTQLVLVPMLFALPAGLVPLVVAAGFVTAWLVRDRQFDAERVFLRLANSWYAIGPALVIWAAGEPGPSLAALPVLAAALAAQFTLDFASAAGMDRIARGTPIRPQLPYMARAWVVDLALTPVGLLAAIAAAENDAAMVLLLPLLGLLSVFARERKARVDAALELSSAYRGTAFLLGDVIEADDAYTGSHSRDVVSLAVAVADHLGHDPGAKRRVELAALLHDVGKIRVPNEIINKAGPLDDDEWAVMKQHTVEGQRMLERVGGLLATVGDIVRSCHERWDGDGYPDGLAGDAIPVEGRIVCACDAFNAMTTDRAYRKALTLEDAKAELVRCAGTHFDPAVVDALLAVA